MRNSIIILLLIALLAPIHAQDKPAATPAKTEASAQIDASEQSLIDTIKLLSEIADVFATIKDKASADAAVPRIKEIKAALKVLGESSLGKPTGDTIRKHIAECYAVQDLINKELDRILAADFYGSISLRKIDESSQTEPKKEEGKK